MWLSNTLSTAPEWRMILWGRWFQWAEFLRRSIARIAIGKIMLDHGNERLDAYRQVWDQENWVPGLDENSPLVRDYVTMLSTENGDPISELQLERGRDASLTTLLLINGYKIEYINPEYGNIPKIRVIKI